MSTITIMEIGGRLRSLGLEQYEAAFRANAVDGDVLRDLTDQDLQKLGVPLSDRRKLLRAIAALDGALTPASASRRNERTDRLASAERAFRKYPRDPLPISPETILAAAAAGASPERQQGEDYSVSPSPRPSPMSSRFRPAEMISDRFLPSTEETTSWLTVSDGRDGHDIQAAEIGEAHCAHEHYDGPASPRWRGRLVIAIAVIALAGLGAVGAIAYRAVFAEAVLPALQLIVKAENAPNEDVPNNGNDRPSDLTQTAVASAGPSEEFVSRFPADNQEPPKTAPISPNPSASSSSALGSSVAAMATTPPIPSIAAPATSLPPNIAAPVLAPPSSPPKKIKRAVSRSDGSGQTDTSATTTKPSVSAARPAGNQLAPDVAATAPEAQQPAAAALPVGRPLSLAPDTHDHSAAAAPSRSRMPAGTGPAAEASSGGSYAVAVASERSVADAEAVFRSLQAKFPNQLGGRDAIVRRTDLGPEGIYYQASIGPFPSMKAAARVCGSLKAAGESCLVEKN
jgi:hypothetical protein